MKNTSKPESTLNKKNNAVCYYTVRELASRGGTLMAHTPGSENPADLMTKVLLGSKHRYLVQNLMHNIYDNDMHPYQVSK